MSANIKISKDCWELVQPSCSDYSKACCCLQTSKRKTRNQSEERYVLQTDCESMIAEIDIGAPNVEVLETKHGWIRN